MDKFQGFLVVVLILVLLFLAPLLVIWSLNIVFGLSILYTWQTWVGTFVLSTIVGSSTLKKY